VNRRLLQWSIGLALVGYVVWFLLDHRDVFSQRFEGTPRHAALLALGVVAAWLVNSLQTLLPLRELGARVGFWENLLLTIATTFGNYLPMRAGSLMRMQYIKSVHGLGYLRYAGVLGARSLMLLWVTGAVGLSAAIAMTLVRGPVAVEVFLLFTGIVAAGVLPFLLPIERMLPATDVVRRLGVELMQAISLVRRNRRMTLAYVGLVVLQLGILTARLAVAFDVVQQRPSVWMYCFLSPIATILSFINITPGNLGLREWLVGLLSAGVGIDYATGIFAASVDRVVLVAMTLSVGAVAAAIVAARMGRHRADDSEP
jgi:uncharacterized membrane protein YbhN (UPF0104 family)